MSDGRAVLLIIGLMTTLPMNAEQQVFDSGAGILRDRTVIACFAHLVSGALYGFGTFEKAAFLVLQADHPVRCVDWPSTHEFKQAQWSGPMPAGVVAVAHTPSLVFAGRFTALGSRLCAGLFEHEVSDLGFEIPVDHRHRSHVERSVRNHQHPDPARNRKDRSEH
jgi:hypothetical protein